MQKLHIHGIPAEAMGIHSQSADDDERDIRLVKRADDHFEACCPHSTDSPLRCFPANVGSIPAARINSRWIRPTRSTWPLAGNRS